MSNPQVRELTADVIKYIQTNYLGTLHKQGVYLELLSDINNYFGTRAHKLGAAITINVFGPGNISVGVTEATQ